MTTHFPTIGQPRFHHTTLLFALAALTLGVLAILRPAPAGATATQRANPTAVAVVNLERLIDELEEYKARANVARREFENRQKEIDSLTEEIRNLDADLKRLDPSTQAFATMQRDLEMKRGFLELRFTRLMSWQSQDDAVLVTALYEKALGAINEVAKRDGWDVVIHVATQNRVPRELSVRPEQTRAFVLDWIQSRRVLYASDAADITSIVAKHMNNQYAAGR